MISEIIEKEDRFNALLPALRMTGSPPQQLLDAAKLWSEAIWAAAEQPGPASLADNEITAGFRLAQNPVFINGVHRSGTTLVRNLLDGHPNLVVLPSEGTFYTNIEGKLRLLPEAEWAFFLGTEWLRRLANPINQAPYWLLGRSNAGGSPYILFARYVTAWWNAMPHKKDTQWPHMAIILAYASCTGNLHAKLWVDKSPANERFLTRIWQEMPEAKIVHVIRDPAATILSRKKMEPKLNLRRALLDLKISYGVAAEQSELKDQRFLLLRYEELCNNPGLIIAELSTFLNVETSPVLSQPSVAGKPAQANSSFAHETAAGQILTARQHIQNGALSIREQQLLSACLGKHAAKLNYSMLKTSIIRKLYLKLVYRLW